MTIFDEIADVRDKIKEIQNKIKCLQLEAASPRSCEFSDMPKSGRNASNPIEQYYLKTEDLTNKLDALKLKFERLWQKAAYQMNMAGIDKQAQKMMYYRFVCGLQWEKCAIALDKKYPDSRWNVNKCFRVYRRVLCKMPKTKR